MERDEVGRNPRREKSESAFRLEKAGNKAIEPERRSVPSWKRTVAKLHKEQTAPVEPNANAKVWEQKTILLRR